MITEFFNLKGMQRKDLQVYEKRVCEHQTTITITYNNYKMEPILEASVTEKLLPYRPSGLPNFTQTAIRKTSRIEHMEFQYRQLNSAHVAQQLQTSTRGKFYNR